MSKEEVLEANNIFIDKTNISSRDMVAALNQYAEQEAIAFRDWCDNGNAWFWDNQEQHTHTTKELYQLFKQQP